MLKGKYKNLFIKYKVHLVLFWALLYIALVMRQTTDTLYAVTIISNFTFLLITAIYSYLTLYLLLPKYGYSRRFFIFFPVLIVSFLAVVVINAYVDQVVFVNYAVHPVRSGFTRRIPAELIFTFLTFTSFASFKIVDDYFTVKWQNEKIQNEALSAELQFLKSQLQPHFLFNVLNNLYFLIQKDTGKASELLLKLSDVMRYQLYESASEKISLGKEIKNISNYIELEKIRRGGNFKLQFDVPSNALGYMIHPYIIMPLIENAFKHLSGFEDKDNSIAITFKLDAGELEVQVINSKENNIASSNGGGIGIKNLGRRLELLYKHRHELKINSDEEHYKVNLKLLAGENQNNSNR